MTLELPSVDEWAAVQRIVYNAMPPTPQYAWPLLAQARAVIGVPTRIVGVVSAHAPAYLDSWRAGRAVEAPALTRLADGRACRTPEPAALDLMRGEVEDIVAVTDDEVAAAMRLMFSATHNVAEGAGAASLAAALQQRERRRGQRIGITLCGGNIDRALFAQTLSTP